VSTAFVVPAVSLKADRIAKARVQRAADALDASQANSRGAFERVVTAADKLPPAISTASKRGNEGHSR